MGTRRIMKKLIMAATIVVWSCFSPTLADTVEFGLIGVNEGTDGFRITESLADAIGAHAGTKITIVALPAKRAEALLRQREIDGDWSRVDGFEKKIPGLIKISEPLASYPYIAYSVRKDIKIDGWKSLKPYRVAYLRGWKVIDFKLKPIHNKLHPVNNAEHALHFLAAGRADVFINIPFIVGELLKKDEFKNKGIIALQPPIDFLHVYIYLLPKHADLAKRMEAGLKAIKKDGTYDRLMSGAD
ncbi:MAG: amino acid ABC transporter substrate-binding protein [Proteobacteria bacterium]|nr:amino acid ABC transporter substrate-binding protein [Pseudomonadota bacterium]